ncbi:MAG: tail fiber domain-containing protein [Flavobacteriaceae bacterium]|nr:tail fiber domain-containing protein [Flavobacteriaceae bacterium]
MKIFYPLISLSILFSFYNLKLHAQIKMGKNPTQFEPYALFELESTEGGLLIPRMTLQERNLAFTNKIPNGLLIFNLDSNCIEVYLSQFNSWKCIGDKIFERIENKIQLGEKSIDLSDFMDNTDDQKLSLKKDTLFIENGGMIDLSPYREKADSVFVSHFELSNNFLELSLSRNQQNPKRVDLSPLISNPQIDLFELQGSTLLLSLANDQKDAFEVNFKTLLQEKAPQLELENHELSISASSSINLVPYLDNTDRQQLSLSAISSQTFAFQLSNSEPLRFTIKKPLSVSEISKNELTLQSEASPFISKNGITHNISPTWASDHFVFGSTKLDNISSTKADNKRFYFNKIKGAFRAGMAESDQWDNKNVGTYSIAMGRNTIADGYHATAFGSKTKSSAWYSTTLGVGTVASSRAEIAMGSYNTEYNPMGNTSKWESEDRLLVIGNGTGSSTSSRSDALVMLKNGDTRVAGNWYGPGFIIVSNRKQKATIQSLEENDLAFHNLQPKQFYFKNETPKRLHFGLLADEVSALFPNLIYIDDKGRTAINFIEFIPLLIQQLQEQQKEINLLKEKIKP